MEMVCPEMDLALSEARKSASAAMSAGSVKRLKDWMGFARVGDLPCFLQSLQAVFERDPGLGIGVGAVESGAVDARFPQGT